MNISIDIFFISGVCDIFWIYLFTLNIPKGSIFLSWASVSYGINVYKIIAFQWAWHTLLYIIFNLHVLHNLPIKKCVNLNNHKNNILDTMLNEKPIDLSFPFPRNFISSLAKFGISFSQVFDRIPHAFCLYNDCYGTLWIHIDHISMSLVGTRHRFLVICVRHCVYCLH